MATAVDSASNNHSPRSPRFSGEGPSSSQYGRNTRNSSSPLAHIVRGGSEAVSAAPSSPSSSPAIASEEHISDSDYSSAKASSSSPPDNSTLDAQPESSDNGNSNVARAKKPAWNKPSDGVVEIGPVMGAVSWPALSESTRASPKSSSDSLKTPSVGSVSVLQAPVIASSSPNHATSNANPTVTLNHGFPVHQKSMKRGGGGGEPANSGSNQQSPPPPSTVELPQSNNGKPERVVPYSSPRDPPQKNTNWESGQRGGFSSQPHTGYDHSGQRNPYRRGNGGPHPRGNGSYNNYGGRRDDWNHHRNFNGRDVHMQPQRVAPRNYIRPPPPISTPFISPPPVRPFGNPMGFPELTSPVYYVPAPSPESFRGLPFVTQAPHSGIYFPAPDPQLRAMLVKQIDYYFSSDNLCKDIYLRTNMDEQGWVSISLIAGFNRIKLLSNNVPFILDAVRSSTLVEVQGDKIRKRNDWMNWTLPPSNQFATILRPQSPGISSNDMLATRVQSIGLEGSSSNHKSTKTEVMESVLSRSSSGEINSHLQTSSGEGTSHDTAQSGSDQHMPAKSSRKNESC